MMRDCWKKRAGYDRVLMTVAATFLTVSASSAFAQNDAPRNSAAELAIDAAVPRPEPANVPPPTAADFKLDTPSADATKADARQGRRASDTGHQARRCRHGSEFRARQGRNPQSKRRPRPNPTRTTPRRTIRRAVAPCSAIGARCCNRVFAEPAKEPVKAASNVAAEDQPVAEKLREVFGARAQRYFDRKAERTAVEKFYSARDFAPLWTHGGKLTDSAKGVVARLKDAASDGLNPSDYPVPDFAAATSPETLADSELKLTASMLDYARHAQSGRMHWSQVSGDIQYPEHPTDPAEVLANVTSAKDASLALDGYNPPHKLYLALKKKLAELRGQGEGPVIQIADGPMLEIQHRRAEEPARG